MGRTVTPTFRIEYRFAPGSRVAITGGAWRVRAGAGRRGDGAPTEENLSRHVAALVRSFAPGGANAHVTGVVIAGARIVRQGSNEVEAEVEWNEANGRWKPVYARSPYGAERW